jgi:hypothetical protein
MENKLIGNEIPPLNANNLYEEALREHHEYKYFSQPKIKSLIAGTLSEIAVLEDVGEKEWSKIEMPTNIAKNIAVIWVVSGPGTYDQPTKDDVYNHLPWAKWMDRNRIDHACFLTRKVAEARSGEDFSSGPLSDIKQRKQRIKELIKQFGPNIIYNGTQFENDTVADVLTREGTIIPEEKVNIIGGDIKITLDQVKTLQLPCLNEDEELAIVSHAPQLARIMHMINKYQPFPNGTKVRLFPVPTPKSGKAEYAKMETLGLLRYVYLDHEATEESYPYAFNS